MRISTKTQYGLRAMTYLAQSRDICSIATIAREEGIPAEFLEKIVQDLKKAGLVTARRGAHGGYKLARNPKKITAGEILHTLEKSVENVVCIDQGNHCCPHAKKCRAKDVWQKLRSSIDETLSSVTLSDLIKDSTH